MIFNKTRKTLLSKEYKLCKTPFSKTIGLMFRKKPSALIFVFDKEEKVSLHMFFVFFPIDVLYLNKEKAVVEIKKKFMPFTFYNPRKKASYVIELPNGTIGKSRTSIGDILRF